MSETMELAVVTAANAIEIFTKGGLAALLDEIEKKVRAIHLDASTPTGRDQIRSVAYKVARTKTALDAEAKKLTEGWRDSTRKVNDERKSAQERLDALADEIRAPLTAFENKEKDRVAGHESTLSEMSTLIEMLRAYPNMTVALLEDHQRDFAGMNAGRNWEEFSHRAAKQRAEIDTYLGERIASRKQLEADQAELERHRKEETARLVREREEKLKSEAAETARIEAERKAKADADAEAKRVIDAARAEEARVKAQADRALAERRARDAEAAREQAERKAEEDLKIAREKARRDADAAAAREREKAASQRKSEEDARTKREADQQLKAKLRSEIAEDLSRYNGDVISAIMEGKIRHVRVIY